jgi:mono/diheme cytochrome c family protein
MKNILRIGLVIMFVSFGALAFSSSAALNFNAEASVTENASGAPRDLYLRNCARCHGADGKGTGANSGCAGFDY